jgi:hypothetical protein
MIGRTLGNLTLAAVIGATALIACSSDDATEKYASADSFCTAKSTEECNAGAAVCSATGDACKSRRKTLCMDGANAATGQGRVYRPQAAEKCINETKALYQTKVVDLEKEKAAEETCERVFTGSKKLNEACGQPYECEGALVCDRGACANKTTKKADEPCNNPGDTCPTGTYCGPRGASDFCIAKNGVDEICDENNPCLESLRCVNQCKDKLESGQPCDTSDDCKTGFCGADKKCGAKLVPGEGGCADFGG